ncbi:MAG: helix-turn-helix domain-containing protein [Alphaproteobacteria bacterium]|nr:helix-turn-helix domain-containing protein [Alphaproteobacteria bacterium]
MREIIRAQAWTGFRELVAELGGDSAEILAAARIDPVSLSEPDRYLPLRAYLDSLEIAADRLGRPDFGLTLGSRDTLASLGALAIAILNAPTARESIEVCARYIHFQNPALRLTLSPAPKASAEFLGFTLTLARPIPHNQNSERQMASVTSTLRRLTGEPYKPTGVWFTHQPMSPPAVYRKVFGVAPQFGKPVTGLLLDKAMLDAFQPGRSAQLRQVALSYLRSLGPARAETFAQRVRQMTRSLLQSGECTPDQAARALGLHPRTLQRRLKEEGTAFETIKDEVRRDMADTLLAQPRVSLSQIALMLDYANSSAFSRSARRWFGESARERRARLLGKPTPARRSATLNSTTTRRRG